jgi:hypothetical protein
MNAVGLAASSPDLASMFSRIRLGPPLTAGVVTLVPLFLDEGGPDAELLEEGIGRGATSLVEVSESGSVNRVRVTHTGPRMLLLVDGEQIIGAKQNRIVNASFLVPPGASVEIPVSCVEHGRWRYKNDKFGCSGTTLTSSARGAKLRRVATSVGTHRGYDADQRAVWNDVDTYLTRTQVGSATAAFADGYRSREAEVEAQLVRLQPAAGQVGVAAVRGETLVALDVFGSSTLYERGWKKLIRGALAEVYEERVESRTSAADVVARTILRVLETTATRAHAPGCGETVHGAAAGVVFGAVTHGGCVYHAVVAG